ncbi:hypothetical protein ACFB49_06780 [Sphingomonas sp. DBB INV C78]|uniref:Zn-ribbon domain-containing OB-fold protein n=1 Tax=Sphingomonas sp. DBB INV C78 TaxID=3349434 RepID=UPI0036D3253D
MSEPGGPEIVWRSALNEGRLLLQRAQGSGTVFFPPRLAEPGVGEEALEWIEASGMGTVYSVTVIAQKPPMPAYNVALIDLDEGPRLMSRVEGVAPDVVTIGMRVRAIIGEEDGAAILLFEPVSRG